MNLIIGKNVVVGVGFVTAAAVVLPGDRGVVLYADMTRPRREFTAGLTSDIIRLDYKDAAGVRHEVAAFDGRYLTAETACSFTGRVAGLFCTTGSLTFESYHEQALER